MKILFVRFMTWLATKYDDNFEYHELSGDVPAWVRKWRRP